MKSFQTAISVCCAAFVLATTATLLYQVSTRSAQAAATAPAELGVGQAAPGWVWIALIVIILSLAVWLSVTLRLRMGRDVKQLRAAIQSLGTSDGVVSGDRLSFEELRSCAVELADAAERFRKEQARLSDDASRDPLTGLANRRPFIDTLVRETAFAQRTGWPLSLIMLDLDHFKVLNDTYGHKAGDTALCRIADRLSSLVRQSDSVARYGGEEFAIILPGTRLEQATRIAWQVRDALRCDPVVDETTSIRVSASFGVAELQECELADSEALVCHADQALYQAKSNGRDTVVAAERVCSPAATTTEHAQQASSEHSASAGDGIDGAALDRDALALMGSTFSILQVLPDRARVARDLVQQVVCVLQVRGAVLYLADPKDGQLSPAAWVGLPDDANPEPSPGLLEWVSGLRSAAPFVPDLQLAAGASDADPYPMVRLPLMVHGELVGVVEVEDLPIEPQLSKRQETILSALSAIGATALQNCSVFERSANRLCGLIEVLSQSVHAGDPHKRDHCRRVSVVARELARAMGQNDVEELQVLRIASLVHDIGNAAMPERLLQKKGRLRDQEWAQLREHPCVGADLIDGVAEMSHIAEIVRHHHEHYDGGGYPDGLAGSAIPMESRIIAVADAYVAMISPRPYRPALTPEEAVDQIRQEAGRQFDPAIVEVFLAWAADATDPERASPPATARPQADMPAVA